LVENVLEDPRKTRCGVPNPKILAKLRDVVVMTTKAGRAVPTKGQRDRELLWLYRADCKLSIKEAKRRLGELISQVSDSPTATSDAVAMIEWRYALLELLEAGKVVTLADRIVDLPDETKKWPPIGTAD
jgi:hypothetical protein